jgi:lambda family phage portal protein
VKILDLLKKMGKRQAAPRGRMMKRQYAAAKVDRLTSSWTTTNTSLDYDLKTALKILRARSRDLVQNNDYARRFVKLCAANVVGPGGIQFQSRVADISGKPDIFANREIERGWKEWTEAVNWLQLQHIVCESTVTDGEVLVRFVRGAQAGNKYDFALHIMEADHLDHDYNDAAKNIKLGVEKDSMGRPVAYHCFLQHPGDDIYFNKAMLERVRIPAEEMLHLFYMERPSQSRGIPWMSSAMTRLNNIGGYEEAEIVAARVGAAQMGFITKPESGEDYPGEKDADDNILVDAEPGTFPMLPAGYDMKQFSPSHPSGNFDPFIKATLRGIASGLDVSYAALSGDLTQASYGSQRQGSLYERDHWMVRQTWFINNFCKRVFAEWLKGYLSSTMTKLPIMKFEKFNVPMFQGRRWQWIDPLKDSQANILQINNRLKSRTEVVAEQGRDFYELVDQIAKEEEYIKSKGLALEKVEAAIAGENNGNQSDSGTGSGDQTGNEEGSEDEDAVPGGDDSPGDGEAGR